MLEASHLAFGKVPWRVSSPQTGIQIDVLVEEVPPPSRTFAAVAEFDGVLRRVARGKEPVKRFGVGVLVAVDQSRGNLLTHALKEGANLGQAEVSGVAVKVRDILCR